MKFFEDNDIYIEFENDILPWVKIFTQKPFREVGDCDKLVRRKLIKASLICEKEMIKYFNPIKINIASFGNFLPRVHIHVQARFENDPYFPESVWGAKQRDTKLDLPPFEPFLDKLIKKISKKFKEIEQEEKSKKDSN